MCQALCKAVGLTSCVHITYMNTYIKCVHVKFTYTDVRILHSTERNSAKQVNTSVLFPGHILLHLSPYPPMCLTYMGPGSHCLGLFTPLSFSHMVCSLCLRCYLCHQKQKYLIGTYDAVLGRGHQQTATAPPKLT